ncbi:MAG: (Fe-S)-binding protein [Planctomycetaceae bacterium]|jgi:L-lactate dehydrogenase complex protein LldE|nr:(Fe-S)-binding protein [Planctomycetaceae bacterium]
MQVDIIDPVLRSYPKLEYPRYKFGERVAFFIPCFIEQFYPSVKRAMCRLFDAEGISFEIPSGQTCCGQPALNSGYWKEARKVMEYFTKIFGVYDWIITPSTSCAAMCRVFFGYLSPNSIHAEVGKRVFDVSEFFVNLFGKIDFNASYSKRVALHIGCHGRRELGIVEQPLLLLNNIKNLIYTPLPFMEECCGFGGTFSVKTPGTSIAIGQRKISNIASSGCEVVATSDLSCAMHFGGMMQRDNKLKNIPIKHIIELLSPEE